MNWYAVHTKTHQEALAELALERLGVETFCPRIQQTQRMGRRGLSATGPLFPGYLFARFHLDTQYRAVNFARGVRKIVAFGPAPAMVDDEMIESIRSRLRNGAIPAQQPLFTPGQTVRVQGGPLRGLEAVFERETSDRQRIVLLFQMLSSQAHLVVDLEHVANF